MIRGRAPVAQLDRAPDFESVGRRFESCRARHLAARGGRSRQVFSHAASRAARGERGRVLPGASQAAVVQAVSVHVASRCARRAGTSPAGRAQRQSHDLESTIFSRHDASEIASTDTTAARARSSAG